MSGRIFRPLSAVLLAVALTTGPFSSVVAAPRFEYKVIDMSTVNPVRITIGPPAGDKKSDKDLFEDLLNKLGAEGWELIEVNERGMAILKRAK